MFSALALIAALQHGSTTSLRYALLVGGASLVHHHCLAPCYSFPHDHSKDTKVPKPIVETGGVGSICCAYHLRYFRKSDIGELRKREVQHSSTPTGLGPPARWSWPDAYDGYFMYVPRAASRRRGARGARLDRQPRDRRGSMHHADRVIPESAPGSRDTEPEITRIA